ncbi:MAG: 4-hydroxy-tetrahydrodipicolinate reductase [Cellvibrionales bacterium]|nr:4-hydroxy-tetrahydrodipicolinate reductase [Cellvibrionales bacterium]
MVRVAISGAAGRMGRALLAAVEKEPKTRLTAALVRPGSPLVGSKLAALGGMPPSDMVLVDNLAAVTEHFDVLVDFTAPAATLENLDLCAAQGKAAVVGTTGFSATEQACLQDAAVQVPIVFAANFSTGIALAQRLLEVAAPVMAEADIEIIEAHHRHKRDAPSGTALTLGQTVAAALGRDLAECARYDRAGRATQRERDTIGFASLRAGDLVGEHTVLFATAGERLEITHKASSRAAFTQGALRAARWLAAGRPAGLYSMADVLGI